MPEANYDSDQSRWERLVQRKTTEQEVFFYGVRTTGIYCRPGCSSKRPKRENVEFFDTSHDAESAGYRPCKRCKPDAASRQENLKNIIIKACRRLEQDETPPTLQQLAEDAGLSLWHFHRLFKDMVGVTPKQFAANQQAERFKNSLKNGQSVTTAIYNAGFSSSSRAYDAVRDRLAMPPMLYRKGAAGLTIHYGIARCRLGWLIVATTDKGICAIQFGDKAESLMIQLQKDFPQADLQEAGPEFNHVLEHVVDFIDTPRKEIDLPLDIRGTAFQEQVWAALRKLAYGETATYSEIAERIGRPQSARAVARACAANKLAVAIPCHRVIAKSGSLSGYRWGTTRKEELLLREHRTSEPAPDRSEKPAKDQP